MNNIVVAVAGTAASLATAKYAIYLAKVLSVRLTGVYVVDEKTLKELLKSRIFVEVEAIQYEQDLREQGELFLARFKKMAESKGVECVTSMLEGVVHEEMIKKVVELGADLLVMGQPKERLSRVDVYYDEGEKILREAPCPVVLVRNTERVEQLFKEI
jgi:nucleotide-binding universal stress UspA family protein